MNFGKNSNSSLFIHIAWLEMIKKWSILMVLTTKKPAYIAKFAAICLVRLVVYSCVVTSKQCQSQLFFRHTVFPQIVSAEIVWPLIIKHENKTTFCPIFQDFFCNNVNKNIKNLDLKPSRKVTVATKP